MTGSTAAPGSGGSNEISKQLTGEYTAPPGRLAKTGGLIIGGCFGLAGVALAALATPFLLPALRKHCLPYVPATDTQLAKLAQAFRTHASPGHSFLDIGSGDGRICRLAAGLGLFERVHGVELNYLLVLYSRFQALRYGHLSRVKYFHKDLWRFQLGRYDSLCVFGVESMMQPLEELLRDQSRAANRNQTIFACRFPFAGLSQVDEIGSGIDTVWVYRLAPSAVAEAQVANKDNNKSNSSSTACAH